MPLSDSTDFSVDWSLRFWLLEPTQPGGLSRLPIISYLPVLLPDETESEKIRRSIYGALEQQRWRCSYVCSWNPLGRLKHYANITVNILSSLRLNCYSDWFKRGYSMARFKNSAHHMSTHIQYNKANNYNIWNEKIFECRTFREYKCVFLNCASYYQNHSLRLFNSSQCKKHNANLHWLTTFQIFMIKRRSWNQ